MERKRLVIDANILIRGCLGQRVRKLIVQYSNVTDFFIAETNAEEAANYIADLAVQKGLNEQICREALTSLLLILQLVEDSILESAKEEALARIRDDKDWPALALSLQLECPVWTEDQDFFGTGVATWTTQTVERYLRDSIA